ncbi:hypothetical protein J4456_02485 [Candidatus Pacearchaeota archaeon]|nr:hypothetical protein [Candidatus Pacearchaeota archaeon]
MAPYRNARYKARLKEGEERSYKEKKSDEDRIRDQLYEPPKDILDYLNKVAYHIETFFEHGADIGKKIKEKRRPSKLERTLVLMSFLFLGIGIFTWYTPKITGNVIGVQESTSTGVIFLIGSLLCALLSIRIPKKNRGTKR